jgi:GDP-4-dehydro-6-deoxy-D-mannose reductase
MRALITGGAGFVGQWLARALLARGDDVHIASLHASSVHQPGQPEVLSAAERSAIHWTPTDFRNAAEVDAAVEASRPDAVFHLAGVSFPPDASREPDLAFDINTLGVVRLLGAIRLRRRAGAIDPAIIVAGSAVQYGRHDESEMPLDESAETRPSSAYAASKQAQEVAALAAFREDGTRTICVRAFNHSGVGHAGHYLIPALVARALRLRAGEESALALGNDVVRDYVHVDDVVTAYLSLADRGRAGEIYNVASGVGVRASQLARDVLQRVGVTAEITSEPTLARSTDIPILVGTFARLARETGWRPAKTYADIIDDLLNAQAD